MKRRDFLKSSGAAIMAGAVPTAAFTELSTKTTREQIPERLSPPGPIRVTKWFDATSNRECTRYDVLYDKGGKTIQDGIDIIGDNKKHHKMALKRLKRELKKSGVKITDLKPFPLPGYITDEEIFKYINFPS